MYVDSQTEFSNAQAVTSTAISTNVLDLQPASQTNATQNVGIGEDAVLVVQTQTACTDTSSDATLTLTLESDTAAGLDSGSATVHYSSGALAFSAYSAAGSKVAVVKLPQQSAYKRYLGLRYTIASGPLTDGKFDAFITTEAQAQQYMASGFTVA
jgi:hypothetical protein